jgi:RNA recognition motif-containing protein
MDSSCKIFVGNVPFDCTNDEFKEPFKNIEGCTLAELVNRSNNSNTRGFGFLTFENSEYANNFLNLKEKITLLIKAYMVLRLL